MKYLISFLIVCFIISCNKEDTTRNASILIKVGRSDDLLSGAIVKMSSDSLLSGNLNIVMESPCGADDAAYFSSIPQGWYHIQAQGYSTNQKRLLKGDTLVQIFYRAGQNHYEINLFMN